MRDRIDFKRKDARIHVKMVEFFFFLLLALECTGWVCWKGHVYNIAGHV